ncbi:hypothetical protein ABT56_06835 [Photobacterium aquae]|uniref:LRAT domain-containing protein n=1 Tax=Photobacterium aquae TaxID=1195763 RepID=A0A0J1H687_9GAMM|nr:lecithin retinol acyltransferase family protein [Photobacterium aquae]KLV07243.1 hypothetical protein ABT56_06835 [Photobacterium aquae]
MTHYAPGTVVKVRCSTYWHYGMADGHGYVVHNSKKWRQVTRETEAEFSEGRQIVLSDIQGRDPEQALDYALSQIGRRYNLFSQNCEQFVREAHGLTKECTQLQRLLVTVAGGYITVSALNPVVKLAGLGLICGALVGSVENSPYERAVKGAQLVAGTAIVISTVLRRIR